LVRIDQFLEVDAVAWIHHRLTSQTTSLLTKYASAHGVITWVFLPEHEFRRWLCLLWDDLLVLRKFRLPPDTAIRGVVDMRFACRIDSEAGADGRSR
jgi:hypothetical protein